jgi:hypothetical protein
MLKLGGRKGRESKRAGCKDVERGDRKKGWEK